MKTRFFLISFFLIFPTLIVYSADFGIGFTGYVKNDFFYDTRQNVTIREGHFLLYPSDKSFDANKIDLNDKSSLNFLSIQSRLTGNITAPDAFGAKTTGVIEADFFGNENAAFVDANGFRLRHAYAKLSWDNAELLIGQFWHPLFITSCFSDVISFNTGAPFQPFSRNPQIRFTYKIDGLRLFAAILEQRDFTSPAGSTALRNSAIPEFQGGLQYLSKDEVSKTEIEAGLGGGYKILQPLLNTERLDTNKIINKISTLKFVTNEKVNSFSSQVYFKYKTPSFTYKLQGIYGQNLFDLLMMGGYAIKAVTDTLTNQVTYTPLNTLSSWTEFMYNAGDGVQLCLWAGYTKNLGSNDKITNYTSKVGGTSADATVRGYSSDNKSAIQSILRISPRIVINSGKLDFAFETEYTSAAYAKLKADGTVDRDEYGKVNSTENINNIRILFSTILKF
jgi:hypothetical protein